MRAIAFLLLLFTVSPYGGAASAFAVQPNAPQWPSVASGQHDDRTLTPLPDSDSVCRITGEEAKIREQDTSNPCLAADMAGIPCFDRFGFGILRANRALLPDSEGQQCRN
jgi:hypothetical protein